MNKIEERLSRAIENAPSVSVEELKRADVQKMKEHDDITMQEKGRGQKPVWMRYAAAAAGICLCILLVFSLRFQRRASSIVDFDVNPSIEIVLNKENKVLRMEAINHEGEEILEDIDYKNREVDQVVEQMLDEMIAHGYLSKEKLENHILLSVEHPDHEKAEELRIRLNSAVSKYLNEKGIAVQVTDQEMSENEEEEEIAEKYGISLGKLTLIRKVMKEHENLKIEDLTQLSLNELIQLLEESREDASTTSTQSRQQTTTRAPADDDDEDDGDDGEDDGDEDDDDDGEDDDSEDDDD